MTDDQKNEQLTPEEEDILDTFEQGEWKSVDRIEEDLARYRAYAQSAMQADQRIEVSLFERDLRALQSKALAAGVPYEAFIAGILHQYAAGKLVEKSET